MAAAVWVTSPLCSGSLRRSSAGSGMGQCAALGRDLEELAPAFADGACRRTCAARPLPWPAVGRGAISDRAVPGRLSGSVYDSLVLISSRFGAWGAVIVRFGRCRFDRERIALVAGRRSVSLLRSAAGRLGHRWTASCSCRLLRLSSFSIQLFRLIRVRLVSLARRVLQIRWVSRAWISLCGRRSVPFGDRRSAAVPEVIGR